MTIGVTRGMREDRSFENYLRWIHRGAPDASCVKLSGRPEDLSAFEGCQGLVLTGGGDVDPELYGRSDYRPLAEGMDRRRDEFEMKVVERALERDVPVLGICRGLQLVNVSLGGTLVPDIARAGRGSIPHLDKTSDGLRHAVRVEVPSLLADVVGVDAGEVNTQHHQSAATPGEGLRAAARAGDGVVESLEWADPSAHPFFLLVQWHPERMVDIENPFSWKLLERFLQAVRTGGVHGW